MKVLELFSGSGTLSRLARERGHDTLTIDLTQPADLNLDVMDVTPEAVYVATGWEPGDIDMLWASPICTGFSVAAQYRNWTKKGDVYTPKTDSGRLSQRLLERTVAVIHELQPRTWYIENPRGMARKQDCVKPLQRCTITYCQYGMPYMKPTDIWFYSPSWWPRPPCRRGMSCHTPAPRGAKTGLTGIRDPRKRALVPLELCEEVIEASERYVTP